MQENKRQDRIDSNLNRVPITDRERLLKAPDHPLGERIVRQRTIFFEDGEAEKPRVRMLRAIGRRHGFFDL